MTPTVYLLPGALTKLDKYHSPAIGLCLERWSMRAIRMLNSPPAQYPHRFHIGAGFPRLSRWDFKEQPAWGDVLVLHHAPNSSSDLMKLLISTWLTLNEMVTLTVEVMEHVADVSKLEPDWGAQMTSVDKREVWIRVEAQTEYLTDPLTGICVVWPIKYLGTVYKSSGVSACSQWTKIAHSDVIEVIINISMLK